MSEDHAGRCPDGGYCHGRSIAAGSEPCEPGQCFRVRHAGPLSGVFPGDVWPDDVLGSDPGPCYRCGTVTAHRTAWEHQRLCRACTDRYFTLIERWHGTLPVTVGRGVQTPGHVTEMPRLTLGQLDEFDRTSALCCERYGEGHDPAFSVRGCPQIARGGGGTS